MERNDWNSRSGDGNRNRYRGSEPRADEDSYRGAYRLDISSDHRNVTTWDGFGQHHHRHANDYNRDYNRNYNRDYNRNYNSDTRPSGREPMRGQDYSRKSRNPYQSHSSGSRGNRDEHFQPTSGYGSGRFGGSDRHDSVHDRLEDRDRFTGGNFNTDYRPDNFRHIGGENSGNMAGSLSFGYDGDNNSDQEWNKWYDPLSGHRRSYHGDYQTRHPQPGPNRYYRRENDDRY